MKVILHIPHASLKVPAYFYEGLTIPKEDFRKYNLRMSDLGVDELFKDLKGKVVKAKYSRLFCDVERFKDDNLEIMSKYGEGVIYTKTYDGLVFHKHDEKYRKKVFKYYDKHHHKLDKLAKKYLKHDQKLLILDLHSFGDEMASSFFEPPFPDICIGIEENYYDEEIVNYLINYIKNKGYSYQINYPYKGSLVPNCIYKNEVKGNVVSIMLEINKRIYL